MNLYEKKYKEALGWMQIVYPTMTGSVKEDAEHYFPELKESEDEIVKRTLIIKFKEWKLSGDEDETWCGLSYDSVIDWLEKQGEQLYIRFGEIPTDEKSKIYRGELEIGTENGVSVYPAFKTNEGDIVLGLNLPITKTTLYTQQQLLEYDNRPCYLVKGDYIGKDTDGQPLINNVSIIKKIDSYRIKEKTQDEQQSTLDEVKIRKWIVRTLKSLNNSSIQIDGAHEMILPAIAWLEKQSTSQVKNSLEWLNTIDDACDECYAKEYSHGEYCHEQSFKWGFQEGVEWLEKQGNPMDKIVKRAMTEKQRVLLTETNGDANIDWDTRSLHDVELLLEYGLDYIKKIEKQREQKLTDKVEPKFNVGDWIISHYNHVACIESIDEKSYFLSCSGGNTERLSIDCINRNWRLWTIQDAKDGDVLVCDGKYGQEIGIIKEYVGKYGGCDKCFETYCFVDWEGYFRIGEYMGSKTINPATKEQRDTLEKAVADAGYRWDKEKLKLEKI